MSNTKKPGFGSWSINNFTFDYIREILPEGKTILELGSGFGTGELAKHYKMYSIEDNPEFIGKYDSKYIYAPIRKYGDQDCKVDFSTPPDIPAEESAVRIKCNQTGVLEPQSELQFGWYDPDVVKASLPDEYDLILVDGPNGQFGRGGFYKYLDWFNTDVPIIIDDIGRECEFVMMEKISEKLNIPYIVLPCDTVGVIWKN